MKLSSWIIALVTGILILLLHFILEMKVTLEMRVFYPHYLTGIDL